MIERIIQLYLWLRLVTIDELIKSHYEYTKFYYGVVTVSLSVREKWL